jgi:hypothetical protein
MDMTKECRGEGKNCVKFEIEAAFYDTSRYAGETHEAWRLLIGDGEAVSVEEWVGA